MMTISFISLNIYYFDNYDVSWLLGLIVFGLQLIMFSCFSKKKIEIRNPQQKCIETTTNGQLSTTPTIKNNNKHALITNSKKSRFVPIHNESQYSSQPLSHLQETPSLKKIDKMLQQGLDGTHSQLPLQKEQQNDIFSQDLRNSSSIGKQTTLKLSKNSNNTNQMIKLKDTHSFSFSSDTQIEIDKPIQNFPKKSYTKIKSIADLSHSSKRLKKKRHPSNENSNYSISTHPISDISSNNTRVSYHSKSEELALETTILQNFKVNCCRITQKISQQPQDFMLGETLQQAVNSFRTVRAGIIEEFTRSIISQDNPALSEKIFQKMSIQEKNESNNKGYRPIQLLVLKAISNNIFVDLAKKAIYDPSVSLDYKGPTGWTPLQEAIFYRSIPLTTHLFKAKYFKKQTQIREAITKLAELLRQINDFQLQIDVKIDSFLPLVGSLTPNDTLKISKKGQCLRLDYSLVGYEFPSCKRRDMSIFFDGKTLYALNNSKKTMCNLLQQLDSEQMILLVEDLLTSEMRRGQPIVHTLILQKSLSLFQNEIIEEIAQSNATKHSLQICYTSTSQKRRSLLQPNNEDLGFLSSYEAFQKCQQRVSVKEKNKNKSVQLQVWLSNDFGLQLSQLIDILDVLSIGNSLIADWSKFLKKDVAGLLGKDGGFPVKIDIPLNFSLFLNIQFKSYRPFKSQQAPKIPKDLVMIKRKQFQGTMSSKQKRAIFLQAYS